MVLRSVLVDMSGPQALEDVVDAGLRFGAAQEGSDAVAFALIAGHDMQRLALHDFPALAFAAGVLVRPVADVIGDGSHVSPRPARNAPPPHIRALRAGFKSFVAKLVIFSRVARGSRGELKN